MDFDPYETWLGIPADRRPPTYYELLGLGPSESDPATIDQAALRRMSKVRQHQLGPQSDLSQEVLAELARARLILMDPDRRTDYDAKLQTRGEIRPGPLVTPVKVRNGDAARHRPRPGDCVPDVLGSLVLTERAGDGPRSLRSTSKKGISWWKKGLVIGAVVASYAVLLGAFVFYVFGPPTLSQKGLDSVRNGPDLSTPTQKPKPPAQPAPKPVVTPKPAPPPIVEPPQADPPGGGGKPETPSLASLNEKDKDIHDPSGPGRAEPSGTSADPKGRTAQTNSGPTPVADGKVSGFVPKAGAAERKKSEARWRRVLLDLHNKGLHARGSETTKRRAREKAEAELDAIDDPMAVPAIWRVFAGTHDHDQLVVRMLARIKSPDGTRMLAALSVYSPDEKARRLATNALRTRDPTEFVEPLISLFTSPMTWRPGSIDIPGHGRAQVLFIEGEQADYRFVYPPPEKPGPQSGGKGVYTPENPYMTPEQRQMAEEFNRVQAETARAATEAQVRADIDEVKRLNQLIESKKRRAVEVLSEATGKFSMPPDREVWRRWLAERQGYPYVPPSTTPKPTIAQEVPHSYIPTFIAIPVPT